MDYMRSVQDHIDRDDDAAPVEMLASLFEARGWPFEFVSDDEISGDTFATVGSLARFLSDKLSQ